MKIATIARDISHSPNMASNDAAILECIANELRARGFEVVGNYGAMLPDDVVAVCHMSRSNEVLQKLKESEKQGIIVTNTPCAVENCSRLKMMQILQDANVAQPPFTPIEEHTQLDELHYPAWLKRANGWSCHKNDVCFVRDASEAMSALREMRSRGITEMIHCEHVAGDIIKFYGVEKKYFHYSYPDPEKSKFGLEKINGTPHCYPFSIEKMKATVFAAAEKIGLEIYGGDCIVCKDGEILIIDMNDFPSFTAVRDKAAKEIAEHITNRINTKR